MKIIKISKSIDSIRQIKTDIFELNRLMSNIIDGIYKPNSHNNIKSIFIFQFSQLYRKLLSITKLLNLDANTKPYLDYSIQELSNIANDVQGLTTYDENILNKAQEGKSVLAKIKFILDLQK